MIPPLFIPNQALDTEVCKKARQYIKDQRAQEYRRLLYVALTRAEERLYICGWHKKRLPKEEECWYQIVKKAMESMTKDNEVTKRQFRIPTSNSTFLCGEGWRLCDEGEEKARDLSDYPDPETSLCLSYPSWLRTPAPREPESPPPLISSQPDTDDLAVNSPIDRSDPHRYQRGLLSHRLLELLPALSPEQRYAAGERLIHQIIPDLDGQEITQLIKDVLTVLEAPDCAPLFGPGSYAEVPIVGQIKGRTVSGQVDRLVITADHVLIADYKTHRHPPLSEDKVPIVYLKQMSLYHGLMQEIYPGKTCDCVLIWTDVPKAMRLSSSVLDRHRP